MSQWWREEDVSWFYVASKQQMGPVSLQGLIELWEKGAHGGIIEDTLLWTEHMSGWTKVKDFVELHELLQARSKGQADAASEEGGGSPETSGREAAEPTASGQGLWGKAAGKSTVISFLKGWLPKRADKEELVKRGILRKGSVAHQVATSPKAPSSDDLFGGSLQSILRRPDTKDGIPALVRILMGKLLMNGAAGLRLEGIFRVPGDAWEMKEMRRQINEGADAAALVQACDDLHSIAGMLKMFFRELSEPVLTYELYDDLIRCSAAMDGPMEAADTTELAALIQRIPPGNFDLLRCLMLFLGQAVHYTSESKMNVSNTAAVFAPNLMRSDSVSINLLADTVHVVNITACLIQHADHIFDVAGLSDDAPPPAAAHPPLATAEPTADEAAAAEPATWYYANAEHQQEGPVGLAALQGMLHDLRLSPSTFVFTEGMPSWAPAREVEQLMQGLA